MPLIPWHTSGPSRVLDPYFGLRLNNEVLTPSALIPWKDRLGRSSLVPWHTSGPSRAIDPSFGLRLDDELVAPLTVASRMGRLKRPIHPSMIPWHSSGPTRTLDPYFGLRLDDEGLFDPLTMTPWEGKCIPFRSYSWDTFLPFDSVSTVEEDKDKFKVNVDVQHFMPEEIKVTLSGNTLTVEGKHEEKPDEHGYISRHFVRKYSLPEDHDLNQVESHLSFDGVLSITAPKISSDGDAPRAIPIHHAGKPKRITIHK